MIKLLIVDDESIVRHGIRHSIPWDEHGISIIGEAENGKIALSKAIHLIPDIIICDIKMPVKDGIELVHKLQEIMPEIRIVMLTGYSDLEYMQEAIRANVCDYLLKPATADQILESVLRIKKKIESSKLKILESQKRDELLDKNILLLRERYIEDLLTESITTNRIATSAQALDIPLYGPKYQIVMAKCFIECSGKLVQDCINAFGGYSPIVLALSSKKMVVSILNLENPVSKDELTKMSKDHFAESVNLYGAIAISKTVDNPKKLKNHYEKTLDILHCGIWHRKGLFLCEEEYKLPQFPSEEISILERRLIDAVRKGLPYKITECAEKLFDRLAQLKLKYPTFIDIIEKIEKAISMIWGTGDDQQIEFEPNIQKIREHFIEHCTVLDPNRNQYGSGQIGRFLRYMEQHFHENLSLHQVAAELYISPPYLSKLIKEKTDLGYHGWLTYFRIQKAKELLANSSRKHYEIAEIIGYSSYKIFSQHFFKVTGTTAKKYRIQFKSQQGT